MSKVTHRNPRVLVCGGRDFDHLSFLCRKLDEVKLEHPDLTIIHGAAKGADSMADYWAEKNSVPVLRFPADWKRYKKAAGAIRNREMLEEGMPDMVVAFPGGRGTENMITIAKRAGIPVYKQEGSEHE